MLLNAQVKICTIFREMEHPLAVKWQETTFLVFFRTLVLELMATLISDSGI